MAARTASEPARRSQSATQSFEIVRLDALQSQYDVFRLPYTLRILLENVLRAEAEGRTGARGGRGGRALGREGRTERRDLVHARARAAAGLHRRPGRRRSRGDARRDARPRRRPGAHQPAAAGRAGDRPLRPGRRVREPGRPAEERRGRLRAERRALRLPALGPAGVRQLQGRPAEHRHRPPGQPRVPRARGRVAGRAGVPRHARRHGLAHDDGERPRRARLGRGRDRGRGRDARRGDLDARPAGRRLPLHRRAARGRDRDRPRPDRDADPARGGRGREVRRVLRPGPRRAPARRPGHDREHVSGVRRDLRLLPGRRGHARLPAHDGPARPSRSRSSRPTARSRDSSTIRTRSRPTRRCWSSTSATSSPRWRVRAGRRTACRCRTRRTRSSPRSRASASTTTTPATTRRSPRPSPRATRPSTSTPARPPMAEQPDPPPAPPTTVVAERAEPVKVAYDGQEFELEHGAVVIAAITSCTNTSNPAVMLAAGPARQERRRARARAQAVGEVVARAGLEGRDRVLRAGRPDAVPGAARFPHGRLRLHDLHRQLGAAARARSRRRSPRATSSSARCSRATATSRRASTPR